MEVDDEIEYEEKFVAYIDILGFKEMIEQSPEECKDTIRKIVSQFEEISRFYNFSAISSCKMFSDCICISCKKSDSYIGSFMQWISFFQANLAENGIFIRGGLAIGRHFENEQIIFSKGLVNALELEKKAVYPRILIHPEIIGLLQDKHIKGFPPNFAPKNFALKDNDERYFLDYLNSYRLQGSFFSLKFPFHKNSIEKQIKLNLNNPKIIYKYWWLAEYYNLKVEEFFDEDKYNSFKIDMSIFSRSERANQQNPRP